MKIGSGGKFGFGPMFYSWWNCPLKSDLFFHLLEVAAMKKEMEEQMRKNQEEMEGMRKSWNQQLSDANAANLVRLTNINCLFPVMVPKK